MTTALQLTLSRPQDFKPVPTGIGHYVAALQNKPGELAALRWAEDETWRHLTPLIEVLGPKAPGPQPFTQKRVDGWVKKVAEVVGRRPVFLDLLRLAPNHLTETDGQSQGVLGVIHAIARKRGIPFVPVLRLGDVPATLAQIADSAACDGRGVALRVPLLGTVSPDGRSTQALVQEALDAVGVEVGGADVLIDLREISQDREIDVDMLASMVDDLAAIGPEERRAPWHDDAALAWWWGGGRRDSWPVAPQGVAGLVGAPYLTGRSAPDLRRLRRPASRATPGRRGRTTPLGTRGAIRYTHQTVTVIPGAKAPRHEEGREQYRQLCRLLVEQPEFAGRHYTWGDRQIADCAEGTCEPGWEDHWRGRAPPTTCAS